MRLLLITNDYPPKPGGIQQYLANIIDAYPDEFHIIAPADKDAEPDDRISRNESTFMWPTPAVANWVEERAVEFAPDAILFGAPHPLPFLGPRLRERCGVPYGVLSHGAEVTLPAAAPGARQTVAKALRDADVRFAVSRFTADRVQRLTGKDVVFVGAGVDIETFTPPPNGENEIPVVGCVSRFVPRERRDRRRVCEAVTLFDPYQPAATRRAGRVLPPPRSVGVGPCEERNVRRIRRRGSRSPRSVAHCSTAARSEEHRHNGRISRGSTGRWTSSACRASHGGVDSK